MRGPTVFKNIATCSSYLNNKFSYQNNFQDIPVVLQAFNGWVLSD